MDRWMAIQWFSLKVLHADWFILHQLYDVIGQGQRSVELQVSTKKSSTKNINVGQKLNGS